MITKAELYKMTYVCPTSRFLRWMAGEEPITKELILDALKNRFLGKDYNAYSTIHMMASTAMKIIYASPIWAHLRNDLSYHFDSRQFAAVTYRNIALFTIEIKKKKGRTHRGYFGGTYCDWSVGEIAVSDFDIEEKVNAIDSEIAAKNDREEKRFKSAVSAWKKIREIWPNETDMSIGAELLYIVKNRNKISDAIKKEAKE